MAKAPGLYRPDGEPARQFGEEIIEPGEPFSRETLSTIRSLVSERTAPSAPKGQTPDEGKRVISKRRAKQTDPTQRAELPAHPANEPEPEIALNLSDLDAYAEDHLQNAQAMQETAAHSPSQQTPSPSGTPTRQPPQPSERGSWRRLVIVEAAPGRLLRSALRRPRPWAMALLIGIVIWRPWAIPIMVISLSLMAVFFVLFAGVDRVAGIAGWGFTRLRKHDPARAERLLRRGNRFLTRVEWVADRLPPTWVQGFHVPDLDSISATPTDDTLLKSRFERIAAEESSTAALAKGT